MYAYMGTFLTAISALHGDSVHVARFDSQLWQLGQEGGVACEEGGAQRGPLSRQTSNKICIYFACVLSSGAECEFSKQLLTNLVTCTRYQSRSPTKLIHSPVSIAHILSFPTAPVVHESICLLATGLLDTSACQFRRGAALHALTAAVSFGPDGRLDTSTDQCRRKARGVACKRCRNCRGVKALSVRRLSAPLLCPMPTTSGSTLCRTSH